VSIRGGGRRLFLWTARGRPGAAPGRRRRGARAAVGRVAVAAAGLGLVVSPTLAATGNTVLGAWSAGHDLHVARMLAPAVSLSDGRVLLTGGFGYAGMLASSEIYEPTRGNWVTAAPLVSPRFGQTATLLANGQVLVAGGANLTAQYLDTAEVYNPPTNTWAIVAPMDEPRAFGTATRLGDGQVLVAGGRNATKATVLASAELYDPQTGTWTPAASMRTARYHFTATLLATGQVLVEGGENANDVELNSAEVYDPPTNTWTPVGSMHVVRANQTATPLADGRVLVVGGGDKAPGFTNAAETYAPSTGRWSLLAPIPDGRGYATATRLPDGRVVVTGGFGNTGDLASTEIFDPASNAWTAAGPLATPRGEASAALLPNGRIVVAGGQRYASGAFLPTSEVFDPTAVIHIFLSGLSVSPTTVHGQRPVRLTYDASTAGVTTIRIRRSTTVGAFTLLPQRIAHRDRVGANTVSVKIARRGHPALAGVYELSVSRPTGPAATIDFTLDKK
jgi:galactose oxidase-like protein/Kelch motif protein